jgi:hypothetical protein
MAQEQLPISCFFDHILLGERHQIRRSWLEMKASKLQMLQKTSRRGEPARSRDVKSFSFSISIAGETGVSNEAGQIHPPHSKSPRFKHPGLEIGSMRGGIPSVITL